MRLHLIYAIVNTRATSTARAKRSSTMEHISEHQISQGPPVMNSLPDSRTRWPRDAELAYGDVLRQLNRWSHDNDWPLIANTWIAEEAIRREWAI